MEKDPTLRSHEALPAHAPALPDVETYINTLETPELNKATVGTLRIAQKTWLQNIISEKLSSLGDLGVFDKIDAEKNARADALATLKEQISTYNEQFLLSMLDADDPSFNYRLHLLDTFSITRMDDEKWYYGERKEDGTYDESKSGQTLCTNAWKKVGGKRKSISFVDEADIIDKIDEPAVDDEPDVDEPDADDEPDVDTTAAELKAEQVADAAAKKAEHALASGKLDEARKALAEAEVQYRTKSMFGRKKHKRAELEALQEAYRLASKTEAVAGFESIKANHIAEDKDEPTAKELNIIAQMAFAEEFKKFANEQNNEAYLTEYGKKARKFGEVSLGKRLKRTALILGLGAVGMATGGVFAAGLFGTATALRIWQTKSAGTVGHSTKNGTERITKKINKKIVRETNAGLSINETGDTNDLADMISTGHRSVSERTRRSNSIRRKLVPVLIASAAAGGVVKSFAEWNEKKDLVGNVRENLQDFDWRHPLHEWNPFNHNEGLSGSSSVRDTADTLTPGSGGTSEQVIGGGFGPTGAPGAMQEAAAAKAAAAQAAELATQQAADLANLDRLVNAHGNYPWGRAMDFFNGDSQAANTWLQTAVSKTPGAQWHNVGDGISTNDWISINGVSDTDAVWKELTKNMV